MLISPGGLRNADLVRACSDTLAVPWPRLTRCQVGVGGCADTANAQHAT
jgi:hypothetical protein